MWGPELLEARVTRRGLRQRVAGDLDVAIYRVRLIDSNGQLVDGESSLPTGHLQLQLILEEK